jgi:uncharacterized protein (TIGR02266 family)
MANWISRLWQRLRGPAEPEPRTRAPLPRTRSVDERGSVRVPVSLRIAVRFDSIDDVVNSSTLDISRGGAFIRTRATRPKGTKVELRLTVGDELVQLHGRVARCASPDDPNTPHAGIGVEFLELDEDATRHLDAILAANAE